MALVLAAATSAVLVVMVIVSMSTGATQERHEWYAPPDEYARALLVHPGALRLMFGLDIAFLVLYTAFFAALAGHLRALGRPFIRLALAAMVGTALLDIVEDHHILVMLGMAERGRPISDFEIAMQQVISASKFSVSFISLVLFGLAIPRDTRIGWALSLFLIIGNLATGVVSYAVPPEMRESVDGGRWIGFLAGFALAALWLRQSRDPASDRS
jgi:hypothetical protein